MGGWMDEWMDGWSFNGSKKIWLYIHIGYPILHAYAFAYLIHKIQVVYYF